MGENSPIREVHVLSPALREGDCPVCGVTVATSPCSSTQHGGKKHDVAARNRTPAAPARLVQNRRRSLALGLSHSDGIRGESLAIRARPILTSPRQPAVLFAAPHLR